MTTQNERLRPPLNEAREALVAYPQESEDVCRLLNRITMLAESVGSHVKNDVDSSCCCLDCCLLRQARDERDEARAEVEMLRGVGCSEDGDGPCGACCKCAYRRGAEAMRQAAVSLLEERVWNPGIKQVMDKGIRAISIPEDK